MAGKQARPLSEADLKRLLRLAKQTRYPERDRAIVLLSVKAGLRACEIAGLNWAMILDANGRVAPTLEVRDSISKRGRGRMVPLNNVLGTALADLHAATSPHRDDPVIESERGGHMRAMAIVNWFARLYRKAGLEG